MGEIRKCTRMEEKGGENGHHSLGALAGGTRAGGDGRSGAEEMSILLGEKERMGRVTA